MTARRALIVSLCALVGLGVAFAWQSIQPASDESVAQQSRSLLGLGAGVFAGSALGLALASMLRPRAKTASTRVIRLPSDEIPRFELANLGSQRDEPMAAPLTPTPLPAPPSVFSNAVDCTEPVASHSQENSEEEAPVELVAPPTTALPVPDRAPAPPAAPVAAAPPPAPVAPVPPVAAPSKPVPELQAATRVPPSPRALERRRLAQARRRRPANPSERRAAALIPTWAERHLDSALTARSGQGADSDEELLIELRADLQTRATRPPSAGSSHRVS